MIFHVGVITVDTLEADLGVVWGNHKRSVNVHVPESRLDVEQQVNHVRRIVPRDHFTVAYALTTQVVRHLAISSQPITASCGGYCCGCPARVAASSAADIFSRQHSSHARNRLPEVIECRGRNASRSIAGRSLRKHPELPFQLRREVCRDPQAACDGQPQ